jgi:hypothetical protein
MATTITMITIDHEIEIKFGLAGGLWRKHSGFFSDIGVDFSAVLFHGVGANENQARR